MIEACAQAGKPVFCEKPLDLGAANAQRCIDVADEALIPLCLGINRRYDQRLDVFGASGMLRAGNDTATRVEVASDTGFVS